MTLPAGGADRRSKAVALVLVLVLALFQLGGRYLPYAFGALSDRASAASLADDIGALGLGDINSATLSALDARVNGLARDVAL
ncbi:MAG: hypothetical protein ABI797_03180, partial [Chloroflexota bacterium]